MLGDGTDLSRGNAALKNEILFDPQDRDYGYGIISWCVIDCTRKDVIMQAHHAEYNDPLDVHDHFSIYTSNAARTSTIKRVNIPFKQDNANWTFEDSTLEVQGMGSSTYPLIHVNNTYGDLPSSQNLLKLTNGPTNFSYDSVLSISQYGTSSAISVVNQAPTSQSAANFASTGKFGYAHTQNASGGYLGSLSTNGSASCSSSNGCFKIAQTTSFDTSPTLWVDARGLGDAFRVANNTNSFFVVTASSSVGIGTSSPYAALSVVGSKGIVASHIHATSTTATSTFAGGVDLISARVKEHIYPSFSYATSTAWTGTTTIPLGPAFVTETWNSVMCFTDAGTVNISFNDGTNRMDLLNGSTTVGTFGFTTNNSFTVAEKRYVDIGTPASSPTKISCTIDKTINP
jgi:hypothetical protein